MMIGGFWQQLPKGSVSFRGDLGSGLRLCGLGARPCTCGLGLDSTLFSDFVLFAIYRRSGKFLEHLATWVSGHLEAPEV